MNRRQAVKKALIKKHLEAAIKADRKEIRRSRHAELKHN